MMKRALSILILCIFLAHFAGFYVYFFLQMTQIRKEMKAQLKEMPAEQLDLIKLSVADFKKAKVDDHEIKVNGKMYDIARIEQKGDILFVYCLHDEAEDNLLVFLDTIVRVPLKDKSAPAQVLKFTSLTFILPSITTLKPLVSFQTCSHTRYNPDESSFVPALDSPPPKG